MKAQEIINEEDYIIIPNPIYDVVFKYLMEDLESAKIILTTLTGEKILKLKFEPSSHSEKIKQPQNEKEIKLFHLDFTATIALPDGTEELVMIELQKANKASDIFRFKRYISANFQKKQIKEIVNPKTKALEERAFPIRLLPIFILNFRIENEINDLVIKINRDKHGLFKDKNLKKQNEFIDHLSYDLLVVQLPNLKRIEKSEYENDKKKAKLFALLKLFDQQSQVADNTHRLRVFKTLFPGFLERIITRLKAADADNPNLENQMFAEDEYLSELIRRDNEIAFFKTKAEKEQKEKEIAKESEQEAKKKEQEAKKKEQVAKQNLIETAKFLKQQNIAVTKISQMTGFTISEIEKL